MSVLQLTLKKLQTRHNHYLSKLDLFVNKRKHPDGCFFLLNGFVCIPTEDHGNEINDRLS